MMKIFIVDDDINIIKLLERIIKDRNLGRVIGYSKDGLDGLEEIKEWKPDIVLVDLLMPGKDGITLVKELKKAHHNMEFIMISQVSKKDMIAKAYESGIEYYIYKPINAVEIESVINKVSKKIENDRTLSQIEGLFKGKVANNQVYKPKKYIECIKKVLKQIGIIGETGYGDILDIVGYLIESKRDLSQSTIKELCSNFTDNPKSMEQRIRRTANVGMVNLAHLGIEDYMNPIFTEYSNSLYNFEQVRCEMDFIRKRSKKHGKVNLKKFIFGLSFYCNQINSENFDE